MTKPCEMVLDAKERKELCKAGAQPPWITQVFPSLWIHKALGSKLTQAMLFYTHYFLLCLVYWEVSSKHINWSCLSDLSSIACAVTPSSPQKSLFWQWEKLGFWGDFNNMCFKRSLTNLSHLIDTVVGLQEREEVFRLSGSLMDNITRTAWGHEEL